MQRREKIMAGALAAVVGIWFVLRMIESIFIAPLTELDGRETYLQGEVDRLNVDRLKLARADKELRDWRSQSLPPDPLNAQRVYLEWLTDLAQLSGFRNAKVTTPTTPKRGRSFAEVFVKVEGTATFQQLQQFIDRFQEVDLLHRIASCTAKSSDSQGNPLLTIDIQAEGLALRDAPPRNRLFPQAQLAEDVTELSQQLTVASAEGFPKAAPFRIRLDDEFLEVTAVQGNVWSVKRGVAGTVPLDHSADMPIDLVPLKAGRPHEADYLAATALFAKPSPPVVYEPKLVASTPPPVLRGTPYRWKAEITGWDPLDPDPQFQLEGGLPGMSIDPRTGVVSWSPDDQLEDGTYPAELTALAGGNVRIKVALPFRLRPPNNPPKIERIDSLTFYFGRESTARVSVVDADLPRQRLTFSLEGAPAGMIIDSRTGVIRWNPPDALEPQAMSVTVKVTDDDELPLSDSITIPITIGEDAAKYTRLISCIKHPSGIKEAWLHDISVNKSSHLRIGSAVQVADIAFKVIDIDVKNAEILVDRDGKPYTLKLGQPVFALAPAPAPPSPAADPAQSLPSGDTQPPTEPATGSQPNPSPAEYSPRPTGEQDAASSADAADPPRQQPPQ